MYIYGSPKIWNSIFWGNTPDEIYTYAGSGLPEIHYCDIQGGYVGAGNSIDSDPLFAGSGDYRLTAGSPCIDTGSNIAPEISSEDKDGNSRIIDGSADMGPYEYEKLAPTVSTGPATQVTGTTALLQGTVNPRGAITQCYFQYGNSADYGFTSAYTSAGTGKSTVTVDCPISGLRPATTYHYRIAGKNRNFTSYGIDRTFTTPLSMVVYVDKDDETCGGKNPCYSSIQAAIDDAITGSAIRIAQGTYSESIVLNQPKTLHLQGGWDKPFTTQAPNTTIIKAPRVPQGALRLQTLTIKP
jgi:hypothetical protein